MNALVECQRNHPCIICWGPFNEFGPKNGWRRHQGPGGGFMSRYDAKKAKEIIESHEKFVKEVVKSIRLRDPQRRPVHDSSGWIHVDTDVWSIHDYTQTLQKKHLSLFKEMQLLSLKAKVEDHSFYLKLKGP